VGAAEPAPRSAATASWAGFGGVAGSLLAIATREFAGATRTTLSIDRGAGALGQPWNPNGCDPTVSETAITTARIAANGTQRRRNLSADVVTVSLHRHPGGNL
jgi:hypothetical protein